MLQCMATFTPKDPKNFKVLTDVKVPVNVSISTETNIADKALVDAAKQAVKALRENPTDNNLRAAAAALAKINTQNQKAMYGYSELNKDLDTVTDAEDEKKAAEALQTAKQAAEDAIRAAKGYESNAAVKSAMEALNAVKDKNDAAAIKAATELLNKAVAAAKNEPAARKAPNVKIKTAKKTLKASKLKKKAQTFKIKYSKTAGSGAATFRKTGGSKKITVSKAGKVKVKKGTKKGKYTFKVQLKVAAKGSFTEKTVKKTITVKVR